MSKTTKGAAPRKAAARRTASKASDFPEIRDWSGAVRGRFFTGSQAVLKPVFVDRDVMAFLAKRAKAAKKDPDQLANDLLRRDIELIRAAGG